MAFYASIAPYYDLIFPPSRARLGYAVAVAPHAERVIDLGCATGWFVLDAVRHGAWALGLDLDEAMVDAARRSAAALGLSARFEVADMLSVGDHAEPGSLDLVTCFGNTLPHLASLADLSALARSVAAILTRDGVFAGQVVNYDRILDLGLDGLPTIENEHVRFVRRYVGRPDGRLDFVTTLDVQASGRHIENSVPLLPVRRAELARILGDAGFGAVEFHASQARDPWTPDAGATFFAAQRQ